MAFVDGKIIFQTSGYQSGYPDVDKPINPGVGAANHLFWKVQTHVLS